MIESYYEHDDSDEVTDRLTDTEKAVKMMRDSSRRTEDQEVISLVVTTLEQQGNICL